METVVFVHWFGERVQYFRDRPFPYRGTHAWAIRRDDLGRYIRLMRDEGNLHHIRRVDIASTAQIYGFALGDVDRYLWYKGTLPPVVSFNPTVHCAEVGSQRFHRPQHQALIVGSCVLAPIEGANRFRRSSIRHWGRRSFYGNSKNPTSSTSQ